jgi:hypothetical protein|eukprot:SAG25_NODE_41_length_19492_cov_407.631671_12_plen_74_part_00
MGSALPELRQHVPAVVHGPLMCRGATSEGAGTVRLAPSCAPLITKLTAGQRESGQSFRLVEGSTRKADTGRHQ